MKKLIKLGLMVTLTASLFLSACAGEYYVSEQPAEPVYDRPAAPFNDDAVWIAGEWNWKGSRYVYERGHWERARTGHVYTNGNWEHTDGGYRWNRGHWD